MPATGIRTAMVMITLMDMNAGTGMASPTGSGACPAMRIMATTILETDAAGARLRLLAWLSPAFPVGSFSYSSGLEGAAHEGRVARPEELLSWIETVLEHGSGWNDAVLFCEAWRRARAGANLADVRELGEALAGTLERHRETMLQGGAFLAAARHWTGLRLPDFSAASDDRDPPSSAREVESSPHRRKARREGSHPSSTHFPPDISYCVAVGAVAGANGVALEEACAAFLQAYASNMIQAGIRLSVLGQSDAVGVLAGLEPVILGVAARAAASTLDDLGSAAIMAELVSMRHETQHSRLFRS